MANTFKLKTKTGGSTAANTSQTVYTTPSTTTAIVLGLTLSNIAAVNIEVTVNIENGDGDNVSVVTNAEIPAKASLEIMSGNKYVMETTDILKVKSNTANSVDTTLSIMEIA
jgi:O-glycosyl hydrolase|tara:strand:+ start:2784 stop:3119 length:336 start_codon:yes stop_codon:yes gene_type:complete